LSHGARDEVRDGICRKSARKEVRHKPKPIHDADLPFPYLQNGHVYETGRSGVNRQRAVKAVRVPPEASPALE
jgi:hypothetical protein